MSAGVLNKSEIEQELITYDPPKLKAFEKPDYDIDASAIDLPLGDSYYEMKASCRPHQNLTVSDLIEKHGKTHELPMKEGTVFTPGNVYLVALACHRVELPENICARATAKSSVGRLDVLVRLVCDHQDEFDRIRQGEHTDLYVEVVPITFDIIVRPGIALSQLRFIRGNERSCTIPREALDYEEPGVLVDVDGNKVATNDLRVEGDDHAVLLKLDLTPDPALGFSGYEAKQDRKRFTAIDPSLTMHYDPKAYWDEVHPKDNTVQLKEDRFYIFRSEQRFQVPAYFAIDCQAYSETLGDIRIHYAGFVHPLFGMNRADGRHGAPLIFEVRGFGMDTILRHGSPLAKLYFRRMSRPAPDDGPTSYSDQELTLSKCFKDWPS